MKVKSKSLTTMQVALMTAAAVVSLRGLPMVAAEELTMFFYIIYATLLFLVPAGLVAAELGSAFATMGGGVYTWVKQAFGQKTGFLAIFLQWIQNVVWYPVVLGFGAAAIAYLIGKPELADNNWYTGFFIIVVYWLATLIALKGSQILAKITSQAFLFGTVLPGLAIVVMACLWLFDKRPIGFQNLSSADTSVVEVSKQATLHAHPRWFPSLTNLGNLSFLAGILLLFAGVEVQAVHAIDMKNPQKQYPKAIMIAAVISFAIFAVGSLAVAIVVPYNDLQLESGLFDAFKIAFDTYHLPWLTNVFAGLAAFGAVGGVLSWITGPSRGLLWTARDGQLPKSWTKVNQNNVQVTILIWQGIFVTLLSLIYFIFKNVNVAFYLLSALTAGLYIIMYLLMYAAAIKLRYSQPNLARPYEVPGGKTGMWTIAGIGFLAAAVSLILCFIPPTQLVIGSASTYILLVACGSIVFVLMPFVINYFVQRNHRQVATVKSDSSSKLS
ncbi:MAG: amino acid permease [bacterium]|nr:amino acid permease [bacterium]